VTVLRDNWTSLLALLISVLFNSLNNESPATTKHSLITLPSSKGFFFLAKIYVILYEAMEPLWLCEQA
jgi:hypothetical protein